MAAEYPIKDMEADNPVPEGVTDEETLLDKITPVEEEEPSAGALVPFDPLQRYLAEIRRYPLLTREQEHELAVEYKEYGNIEAAYKLVTSNLRLVVMIAREYEKAFRNLLDLIQEGNIGLMESLKNFDPYRGVRFPSYAVWWIRAYMIRYLMNNWRMVEGFTPGPKLIAERLDVKEAEVVEMDQRLSSRDLSTDVPIGDGEDVTLLHILSDDSMTPEEKLAEDQYRGLLKDKMAEFGKGLKDKELVVFRERLVAEEPVTLREIGEKYGISRERVRQIEERVKRKLKAYLSKEFGDLEAVEQMG